MHAFTRVGLVIGTVVLGASLAGTGAANAQNQNSSSQQGPAGRRGGPGGPGRFGGPGGRAGLGPMELQRLNLTDGQREQVRSIMESHGDERRAAEERAMSGRDLLATAVASPTFDEAAVRTASAELAAADVEVAVLRAKTYAEIFQILTPEQQSQLTEMQARMRQRNQDRRQRFEERGGRRNRR